MKAEPSLLCARRERLASVLTRQRAFAERLFRRRRAARATPLDRVMRRAVLLPQPLQHTSVHQWMLAPVLSLQRVERQLRVERHGPQRNTERLLQREREHVVTLRQTMLQHATMLLQRHASVLPVSRAMSQALPTIPASAVQTQAAWLAPRAVSPVPTTVLASAGRAAAAQARRPADPTRQEAAPQRSLPPLGAPLQAMVLPAQEMSRVTEHVMQQLDRRMVSCRERLGRV